MLKCSPTKYYQFRSSFVFNDNNIGEADNRNLRINLVIDNTNTIDRFNILLFKEAMKINERKPTLNTGLKASKALQ